MSDETKPVQAFAPIKMAGHINLANERGFTSGCKAVEFHPRMIDGKMATAAEQMNDYFESGFAHANLVAGMLPLSDGGVIVFHSRRIIDEDKEEMDDFMSQYQQYKEKKQMAKLESERKVAELNEKAQADAEHEREVTRKKAKLLITEGIKHLKNCKKKDAADVKAAEKVLAEILELNKPIKQKAEAVDLTPKERP